MLAYNLQIMSNEETRPAEIPKTIEREVGDGVATVAEASAPVLAPNIHQMRKILKDMSEDMKAILQRENLKRTKSETANRNELSSAEFKESELGAAYSQLYPSHDDPAFTVQLAEKKEFYDTHNPLTIDDVERQSEKICRGEFELAPHQMFIRNFLSPQTPYNSILLYHGLGTGKTCTAASACETARDYSKQIGDPRRIIVVASPNVLENFQRQLFNESKLREVNGVWNIRACTGNKFLREINPMNTRGLARDVVVRQIRRIINESYAFLGYGKFANYIQRTLNRYKDPDPAKQERLKTLALRREFSNRMIVIDEVHNIRIVGDVIGKAITSYLLKLVMAAENVKLLLMSATPMYNSAEEIIWLLNLMNANDRRSRIRVGDVFNPDGTFRRDSTGAEIGKQILMNKARGYISYVRGENPYSFPYRIYPSVFAPERSILSAGVVNASTDLVGRPIGDEERISVLDLYTVPAGTYQGRVYLEILRQLREKLFGRVAGIGAVEEGAEAGEAPANQVGGANGAPQAETDADAEDSVGGLGYSSLEPLIQSLNIIYPNPEFDDMDDGGEIPKYTSYIGEEGLKRIVNRTSKNTLYEYKPDILARYGRIFDPDQIGKYSAKIASVCESIRRATGIVLVFSQYIPGGCIPIALALEAMGLTRYTGAGGNQLWKERVPEERRIVRGSYVMITANGTISPNNDGEVRAVTAPDNVNGEKIRVVIISRAGSEGIDFQNLRQVHIMEPWYNVSRQEQIIGRAIRYCSHIELPFRKRNAEIFQYATTLPVELAPREEAADLYVYRIAEKKAIKTGIVSRVLKETAVDCLLNEEQNSITEAELEQTKTLELADGKEIEYRIGDKPYTALCDFMGECEYLCKPEPTAEQRARFGTRMDTYSASFIQLNIDSIIRNIRELFKTETVFSKKELVRRLKLLRNYPDIQIDSALDYLIKNRGEYLIDGSGRMGRMVNMGDTYAFQPIEITDDRVGRFERTYPVDFKHESMRFVLPAKEGEVSGEGVVGAPAAAAVGPAVSAIAPRAEVGAPVAAAAAAAAVPAPAVAPAPAPAPALSSAVAEILSTMETEYNRTLRPGGSTSDAPDWFDAVRKAREHLNETYEIDSTELNQLVVAHQIDSLMPIDKMRLLSWLISPERRLLTEYQQALVYYLESSLIVRLSVSGAATGAAAAAASGAGSDADEMSCFIILNTTGTSIATFVYPLDGSPIRAASIRESERINERLEPRLRRGMKPNTIFGFIEIFKEQGYMIMKTRDMTIKRTKGARCDQKTKSKIIALLNSIVGKAQYSIENTKKRFDPVDLCMITEIVLRKFDRDNKDGKRWFYLPEHYRILASSLE